MCLPFHCSISSTQMSAWSGKSAQGTLAEGRRVAAEEEGEAGRGYDFSTKWQDWGSRLGLCPFPASPGSFPSAHHGGHSGATLRFWGWQTHFPCLGIEADGLKAQTSALNSWLTQSQRSDKNRVRELGLSSPVITHPFTKEGTELCLYLGSLYSRKY